MIYNGIGIENVNREGLDRALGNAESASLVGGTVRLVDHGHPHADFGPVADREQGLVVRLDPAGKVLQPRYVTVTRPRMLLLDDRDHLWIGTDGTAETPFQSGSGEIWRVSPEGEPALVLRGPLPAGMSLSPGGSVFVAQRRTGQVFAVAPDGRRIDFVGSTDGTALRGLRFVPVAPATRRAGIAGDLLLVVVTRQMWALNRVLRVSGPFDDFVRQRLAAP